MSTVESVSLNAINQVSLEELVENVQEAQMNVLKKTIETEAAVELQMVAMMADIMPHLGANINTTV